MTAVTTIKPHLSAIAAPAEIRALPAWLTWRYEHHEGEDRPRKVPYYTGGGRRTGVQGSADDRKQLTTFDAARAAAARKGMDGVGLALMPEWGVVALDFDHCVAGGVIHPEVEPLLATSYAEYSPSGTGIRVLLKGNLGNRKSHDGPFGFETFSTKGFVTFTGNRLEVVDLLGNADTLAEVDDQVIALCERRFGRRERATTSHDDPVLGLTESEIGKALAALDPDMGHDDWLAVGMALHHETRGDGFDLWDGWSAGGSKYPGREILQHRWASFGRNPGAVVTARTLVKMAGINRSAPATAEEFKAAVQAAVQAAVETVRGTDDNGMWAKQAQDKGPRFQFVQAAEFAVEGNFSWLVKHVLPRSGLAVVYGESGAGKSFAVLDIGMAIARGVPWRGQKTTQGKVAYIVAEGSEGFKKRLRAYAQRHEVELAGVPFTVLAAAPNLMLVDDVKDLAVGVLDAGGADVIVVDTLAQTTPGANENAGEDMGKALGHCKRLHEATGALVLLVHHSGKDKARGARGWSGLRAACDAEVEVLRDEATGARELRLSKAKDDEDNLRWGFALEKVQVGVDEDLEPITSCAVIEAEVPKVGERERPKLKATQAAVYDAAIEMAQVQTVGIEAGPLIDAAVARLPVPEGEDGRRSNCRRALTALLRKDWFPLELDEDGTLYVV